MTARLIPTEVDDFLVDKREAALETLQQLIDQTSSLEVVNKTQYNDITELFKKCRLLEKDIEINRKKANQPWQDIINSNNDKAKEILIPLKQIQTIAKQKCERYQLRLEEAKKVEEKRVQEAVDLLGLDETPVVAPLEKAIRGDGAIMYSRTVRKFRVVDLSKVPLKYLQINQDLVERDMNLGVDQIPGIEMFDEKVTQLRTR